MTNSKLKRPDGKPLSVRLTMIAQELSSANLVVDVGSDHGYISAFALANRITSKVIATDIHKAPAERTRKYLQKSGFSNQATVLCTDGLSGVAPEGKTAIVIAGIGGLEIIRIINDAIHRREYRADGSITFLIQPQRSEEQLRTFLSEKGIEIIHEKICFERNKVYVLIVARYFGRPYALRLCEKLVGPMILRERPTGTDRYIRHKLKSIQKQSIGRPELDDVVKYLYSWNSKEGSENL